MGNNDPNYTKPAPIWHQATHFGHPSLPSAYRVLDSTNGVHAPKPVVFSCAVIGLVRLESFDTTMIRNLLPPLPRQLDRFPCCWVRALLVLAHDPTPEGHVRPPVLLLLCAECEIERGESTRVGTQEVFGSGKFCVPTHPIPLCPPTPYGRPTIISLTVGPESVSYTHLTLPTICSV